MQLADALVRLLSAGSFAEISVADIAREAGLASGLVHHYFRDKDEVLKVAVERMAMRLELRLTERLRGTGARARVHAFIDAWLSPDHGADPRAAFAWVSIGDEARRKGPVQRLYLGALERATARLRDEVAEGLTPLKQRRADRIAKVIMIAIEGALRVGAAGGLPPGSAAPLVRGLADALASEAAGPADLEDHPPRRR